MATVEIALKAATAYRTEHYGISFEGATLHNVTGRGVHNPSFPHSVTVWDNTVRPNSEPEFFNSFIGRKTGPGRYVDPSGRGTDNPTTIIFGSESVVISAVPDPDRKAYGSPIKINDTVRLILPNGDTMGEYVVTARFLDSPILVPISE